MKKFFVILAVVLLFAPTSSAQAGTENCRAGSVCECLKSGKCGRPHGRATCLVKITAPTIGNPVVSMDIHDGRGKSILPGGGARKRKAVNGFVSFTTSCGIIKSADLVLLCTTPEEGTRAAWSLRDRRTDALDKAVITHELRMCLQGDKCENYVEGPPPFQK